MLLFEGQELLHFDDKASIEVHTDASAYGFGGVLIQNDKPVWCVSASMTESQKVWGATDRELLAVKQVVKKLSRFLWGRSFTFVIDHEPLLALFQKKEFATERREEMVLSMLEFDFTLRYKPGKLMIFPDALSRVLATVAGIVKTVTQEEGRLFFEEAHIDLGKHYDIRSWISRCGCSFGKDGRRRRKRGIHNPLDLGRYPVHVVSADLYSWVSQIYLTLLDLYSDKIWEFQIY